MTSWGRINDAGGEQLHSGRRTLAVLETIAAQPRGVTPKQVSQALKMHLSTCYRLLNTLLAAGYVVKSPDGHFTLGRRVAYLNHCYQASVRPRPEVLAFLHALQLATSETAMLCRLEGDEVVVTASVEGSRPGSHPAQYIGLAGPAYALAIGRVLLAGLPTAQRDAALLRSQATPDLPWWPRVNLRALHDEVASIQQKGYAIDPGNGNAGVCCYAAPVRDRAGVAAAVAVIAPCARLRGDEARVLPVLLEVGRAITALLIALPEQEPGALLDQAAATVTQAAIAGAHSTIADTMPRVT